MKSLVEFIKESTKEEKHIDIKSDIIEMQVPESKIKELAKILNGKKFTLSDKKVFIELDTDDLSEFVCSCNLLNPDEVDSDSSFEYYIKPGSHYIPSDEKNSYVRIINADAYTKQKEINIDDCGHCTKSDDKVLDFYWIQHYSEGDSLNVVATSEQVALAIIIDLSAKTAKANMKKSK